MRKFLNFYTCGNKHSYGTTNGIFGAVSSGACNVTLAQYFADPRLETCNSHANCILSASDTITPQFMAQLSSGNVMLGLTPGLLSTLGPTVGEISLLSSKVPILSFLLSMGAAVIYPTRPFDYSEPTEILHKGTAMSDSFAGSTWDWILIVIEYVVAAGAVGNVWENSYQLGRNTTFSPICNDSWWVLGWTAIPTVIHILAAVGYNSKIIRAGRGEHRLTGAEGQHCLASIDRNDMVQSTSDVKHRSGQGVAPQADGRPRLSVRQQSTRYMYSLFDRTIIPLPVSEIPLWLKFVNSSCSFLSYVHIIAGVFIFSSLQFVCSGDAVGILGRYLASAVVCRLILLIEFARMRLRWREGHPRNDEAPLHPPLE